VSEVALDSWSLVAAVQAGDRAAFGQLYDRYRNVVQDYLWARVCHRELAEDLTSETFTRALARIHGVRDQGRDFGAWLITIAKNIVRDHVKSAAARHEVPVAVLPETNLDAPVEQQVLARLDVETVGELITQLAPAQRECLRLYRGCALPVQRVATEMGCSVGAVKALRHRAVSTLVKRMTTTSAGETPSRPARVGHVTQPAPQPARNSALAS
jgi:RNA polymerase sigma-70 factor, ECF subfamily